MDATDQYEQDIRHWIPLRCPGACHGYVEPGSTGRLDVECFASRCKCPEGIRVHVFDLADGSYRNRTRKFRGPLALRGLPGVKEERPNGRVHSR